MRERKVKLSDHRTFLLEQDVADACRTGAATNIIFGLALGYKSAIIPCIVIAVAIFISFSLANMFGIACAALGMLTTLATGVAGLQSGLVWSLRAGLPSAA